MVHVPSLFIKKLACLMFSWSGKYLPIFCWTKAKGSVYAIVSALLATQFIFSVGALSIQLLVITCAIALLGVNATASRKAIVVIFKNEDSLGYKR